MLEKGIKAPDFTLLDKNGEQVSLSVFRKESCIVFLPQR